MACFESSLCGVTPDRLAQEAFWQRLQATAASPAAADAALAAHLVKLMTAPSIDSRACLSQALDAIDSKVGHDHNSGFCRVSCLWLSLVCSMRAAEDLT